MQFIKFQLKALRATTPFYMIGQISFYKILLEWFL